MQKWYNTAFEPQRRQEAAHPIATEGDMQVQEYLRNGKTYEDLAAELGIKHSIFEKSHHDA